MERTFHHNQWLLVRRLNWPVPPLRKGDVVVFRIEGEPLVKRIAALPGEPFPDEAAYYVNGFYPVGRNASDDPSSTGATNGARVPEGHLYVLGDNQDNSDDSRAFGPIPRASLLGRVLRWTRPPRDTGGQAAQEAGP
jgi:signal peptidase I